MASQDEPKNPSSNSPSDKEGKTTAKSRSNDEGQPAASNGNGNGNGYAAAASPGTGRSTRAEASGGVSPQNAGARGPGAANNRIAPRRPQFMIATRAPQAGLQLLSADLVEQQLINSPDIEFVKRIEPPRVLDLQSTGGSTGPVMLARMDFERAQQLRAQAGPRATVERDMPLAYSLEPGPADLRFKNPGVLIPHAAGFITTIEVTGDGTPLEAAEVYIYGSTWPTQAITDATGKCTISVLGESPDTINAIYVKPKLDYWSFWLPRPQLVPNGTTSIEVKPLSSFLTQFPGRQLMGWGCVAMGLDQVPQAMNGAGVKIAIIDSGAAQPTHRNLRQVGPGRSIVGPNDQAWTDDIIGHGSHCAGIIAGGPVGPNGAGVRGFAPGAEIHICRVFPGGRFSDVVEALDYCMEKGIDVVNMSLGGSEPSQIIEERLVRAKQMGIACIVAAGNSGGPVNFPASTPHALAVSAIGKWGEFPDDSFHSHQALGGATSGSGYFAASFSCFGPEIDVCGPGVAIVSSLPPDGFGAWDGTSMATPHITGLAALVLAHHPDFKDVFRGRDYRRVERLFQIIRESATPLAVDGERQGAGLPSVPRALGLLAQVPAGQGNAHISAPDAASIEALRQLLGLIGGGNAPQPQSVGGASAAFQPTSAGLSWQNAEPWSNAPVSRGPASTGGVPSWVSEIFSHPQVIDHRGITAADVEAYRQYLARGGQLF